MFSWPVGSKDEGAAPEIDSQIDSDITPDITSDISPEYRPMGRRSNSETSWVLAGGAEGGFLCSLITDFLAEGAGWGASPGRGGELGCQGAAGA